MRSLELSEPRTKSCRMCETVKHLSNFQRYMGGHGKYTWHHLCKPCRSKKRNAERVANADAINAQRRERYRIDPEYRAAQIRRATTSRYGVGPDWREAKLAEQGGVCAICRSPDAGKRGWAIDHDHSCCDSYGSCGNCLRGVLCTRCNTMLGMANDNIEVLHAGIEYVQMFAGLSGAGNPQLSAGVSRMLPTA